MFERGRGEELRLPVRVLNFYRGRIAVANTLRSAKWGGGEKTWQALGTLKTGKKKKEGKERAPAAIAPSSLGAGRLFLRIEKRSSAEVAQRRKGRIGSLLRGRPDREGRKEKGTSSLPLVKKKKEHFLIESFTHERGGGEKKKKVVMSRACFAQKGRKREKSFAPSETLERKKKKRHLNYNRKKGKERGNAGAILALSPKKGKGPFSLLFGRKEGRKKRKILL